ncbi:MAG: response regulator, partial [Planctomycetaceae bacterium]|nr:response regulator [Planctomycetaceae bacterium]
MSGIIAQRKSILIVEDEPIIRETLAEFLMGEGFEVRTTGTVAEALSIARERDYDVAVCDIQLPDGDGVKL